MKKLFFAFSTAAALALAANAIAIDEASVVSNFTAYKQAKKIGVKGVINKAVYHFAANEGSVKKILEGTVASMDFTNENTKDKMRDKNIHRTYIANLASSKIDVKFFNVSGNDESGKAQAKITFNNVTKTFPVTYKVENNKLIVSSQVNMKTDFDTGDSYLALSSDKQIMSLHGKKTWEEVDVNFTVNLK